MQYELYLKHLNIYFCQLLLLLHVSVFQECVTALTANSVAVKPFRNFSHEKTWLGNTCVKRNPNGWRQHESSKTELVKSLWEM